MQTERLVIESHSKKQLLNNEREIASGLDDEYYIINTYNTVKYLKHNVKCKNITLYDLIYLKF